MCLCSRVSQGFLIACLTVVALAAFTRYQSAHAHTMTTNAATILMERVAR